MGILGRIREGLSRTTQQIVERFDDIVRRADAPEQRSRPIDVDTVEALEELLISADIGVAATDRIITAVTGQARNGTSLRDLVKHEIRNVFAAVDLPIVVASRPQVTLIVGVNGTGKTTTVGKLANLLKTQGRTPLICAADTFRAAAVEQLEILGAPRRRRHGAGARRRRSGRGRLRRDHVRQGEGPRSDPHRHGRPAAHPRQPDERARKDPAHRVA
jgi:fused signal recognition particle receptor